MPRKTGHYHTRRVPLAEWPPLVPNPDPQGEGTVPADAQMLMNMGLHEVGRDDTYVYVDCSVRDEARAATLPGVVMATDRGKPGARFDRLPPAVKGRVLRREVWRGRFDVLGGPPDREAIREHVRSRAARGLSSRIQRVPVPAGDVQPGDVPDDDGVAVPPLSFAGQARQR